MDDITRFIGKKIGITSNYEKLYEYVREQLQGMFGDEDSEDDEESNGWGVEYLTLRIMKNDAMDEDLEARGIFSGDEISYLRERVHNLEIHIERQGNSPTQYWELWFKLDLSKESDGFIVHCNFRYEVGNYGIEEGISTIVSEEYDDVEVANKLEKIYMFEILKSNSL
jgi:hypothetical protein